MTKSDDSSPKTDSRLLTKLQSAAIFIPALSMAGLAILFVTAETDRHLAAIPFILAIVSVIYAVLVFRRKISLERYAAVSHRMLLVSLPLYLLLQWSFVRGVAYVIP